MDYFFYDRNNNLVSIANAILFHFTGKCFHTPHEELTRILKEKNYQKVCIMLFDGLGKSIEEKHLTESDYLLRKKAFEITSVFPPTTAAATTSITTGKYPVETGFLGWQQYFKQHDLVVEMFTNRNAFTKEKINGPVLSELYCPNEKIWEILNKNSIYSKPLQPFPIDEKGPRDLKEFFEFANIYMKHEGSHFYYMYHPYPDSLIHMHGTTAKEVHECVKYINKEVRKLAKENPDNLIIVLADHSLIDTKWFNIYEHDDFSSTLKIMHSLDSRSSFFHVKEGQNDNFVKAFNKYYSQYFKLFTREEVIKLGFFGEGTPHPLFNDFLGDYMATSISNYGFTISDEYPMIGAHSGSLEEESRINVAILNR